MRVLPLLLAAAALVGCSTPSVVGPYRTSLSREDLQRIVSLAKRHRRSGELQRIEVLAPDKARLEVRVDIELGHGSTVDVWSVDFRYYVIKENGEWHPVTTRRGEIKREMKDSSGHWVKET